MLNVTGPGSVTTCDGVTRRDFLQIGSLGALGFSLSEMLGVKAMANPTAAVKSDKSCILIFNLGAPSQLDCWDPKPDAPREIRGPFKPISTKGDFQITEIFPQMAKVADQFSLERS